MSEDALALLSNAPRLEGSPYLVASISRPDRPMSESTYSRGWERIPNRTKISHVGTHGVRHRATTEIANSGVPVKVAMQLTAHKTVTQFVRYVHTEDAPVRAAAEVVAMRKRTMLEAASSADATTLTRAAAAIVAAATPSATLVNDSPYTPPTKIGAARPFRHRRGANRAVPPGTKRAFDPGTKVKSTSRRNLAQRAIERQRGDADLGRELVSAS